jgi:hypothetical protein
MVLQAVPQAAVLVMMLTSSAFGSDVDLRSTMNGDLLMRLNQAEGPAVSLKWYS